MSHCLRVLCVDDDPDIRTIALIALGLDPRMEARGVPSGAEALALLNEQVWQPDVILLDVMMGGMSGPSLLTAIHDSGTIADIPIIFMTARANQAAFEEYRALGATGVIVKPFDPVRLAAEVRELLAPDD